MYRMFTPGPAPKLDFMPAPRVGPQRIALGIPAPTPQAMPARPASYFGNFPSPMQSPSAGRTPPSFGTMPQPNFGLGGPPTPPSFGTMRPTPMANALPPGIDPLAVAANPQGWAKHLQGAMSSPYASQYRPQMRPFSGGMASARMSPLFGAMRGRSF